MSTRRLYKAELVKYLKKPITYVLFICLALPVFYNLSMLMDASYISAYGTSDALLSASLNWGLLTMTGIPEVLFALVSAHIFAYELERGQIRILAVKVCDRRKIVISKWLVVVTFVFGLYVIFHIFNLVAYYTILIHTESASGTLVNDDLMLNLRLLIADWIGLTQILFVCGITFLFSMYFKAFASFMLSVSLIISFMIMTHFPIIQYIIPSQTAWALSMYHITMESAFALSILYLLAASLPIIFTAKKFMGKDI